MTKETLKEVKEKVEKVESSEIPNVDLPKFIPPQPDPRCKKCNGTGRLGYAYDPKNIEYDENGNRKRGKPIPCPKYSKIIQDYIKDYMASLTNEQQYAISRKDGDPETLAEAIAIQNAQDAEMEEEYGPDGVSKITHMEGTDKEVDGPLKGK